MDWMLLPLKRYSDFQGRSQRKEFWMYYLLWVIIYVVLNVLVAAVGSVAGILAAIVYLALLIPTIAVGVRRMHDVDKSGWFLLIPIYSLILALTPGTPGPNRFGPDPLGGNANLANTFT